jgi:tetratricopeptide (TPR) repeat protein
MISDEILCEVRTYLIKGEIKKARKLFDEIKSAATDSYRDTYWLNFLKIEFHIYEGNYKQATSLNRLLITDLLDKGELIFEIQVVLQFTQILFEKGKYLEGLTQLDILQSQIDRLPSKEKRKAYFISEMIHIRSYIVFFKGEIDQALEMINLGIETHRKYMETHQLTKILQLRAALYWNKGLYERAEGDIKDVFRISQKDGNLLRIGKAISMLGLIYLERGNLDLAITYLKSSISMMENSEDLKNLGIVYLYLTDIYKNKGELNRAFHYGQRCYKYFVKLESDHFLGEIMYYLGLTLKLWGDQEAAIKFLFKSVEYHNKVGRIGAKALSYLAEIYHQKKDFKNALKYYLICMEYFEETGYNLLENKLVHYNLIKLYHEYGNNEENLKYHLNRLIEMDTQEKTPFTNQMVLLSKAIRLKSSKRLHNLSEAQCIYLEVANEEICFHDFTTEAIINVCDILVYELKMSGVKEIISELSSWINRMKEIARNQPSYSLLVEVLLLQSKIALVKLDFDTSNKLLIKAEKLTEKKNLKAVLNRVKIARSNITEHMKFLKKIQEEYENPPIGEILQITGLAEDLSTMLSTRQYPEVSNVLTYADKVRALYG